MRRALTEYTKHTLNIYEHVWIRTWNYTHISYFNRVLTLCQYLQYTVILLCRCTIRMCILAITPTNFILWDTKQKKNEKKNICNSNCSNSYIIVRVSVSWKTWDLRLVAHQQFALPLSFYVVFDALLLILVICTA